MRALIRLLVRTKPLHKRPKKKLKFYIFVLCVHCFCTMCSASQFLSIFCVFILWIQCKILFAAFELLLLSLCTAFGVAKTTSIALHTHIYMRTSSTVQCQLAIVLWFCLHYKELFLAIGRIQCLRTESGKRTVSSQCFLGVVVCNLKMGCICWYIVSVFISLCDISTLREFGVLCDAFIRLLPNQCPMSKVFG